MLDGFVPGDAGDPADAQQPDAFFDDADVIEDSAADSPTAESARILFPPPCAYPGDAIDVRGEASGAAVRINGVNAESSDGFQTWHARVPLVEGDNLLRLEGDGGEVLDEVLVVRGTVRGTGETPGRPLGIAWDETQERVLLTDDFIDGIWTATLATGDRNELSHGVGHEMVRPAALIVDGTRAIVSDGRVIVTVDLTSAEHVVLSGEPGLECPSCPAGGPPRGEGPLGGIRGMVMYEGRLLALMNEVGVVEVNQENGDRTVFEEGWENATSIALDGTRALITPVYSDTLHVLDLATRERSTLDEMGGEEVVVIDETRIVRRDDAFFRLDEGMFVPLLDANVDVSGVQAMAAGRDYLLVVTHHPSWLEPPEELPRVLAIDHVSGTVVTLSSL